MSETFTSSKCKCIISGTACARHGLQDPSCNTNKMVVFTSMLMVIPVLRYRPTTQPFPIDKIELFSGDPELTPYNICTLIYTPSHRG